MDNMRGNIRRVFWLYFFLFALTVGYLGKFAIFDSRDMVANAYNPRLKKVSEEIVRGQILDGSGIVLAESVPAEGGGYKRVYPLGRQFAHLVGYTKRGESGLEAKYNFELQTLSNEVLQRSKQFASGEPLIANGIALTVDSELQRLAYELLNGQKGAIVVMEPSTGKILAMVSYPDFDPNTVDSDWEYLMDDNENSPLLNRVAQGLYPPGSVFKILTATAFMESVENFQDFEYICEGSVTVGGKRIRCFNSTVHGHEHIDKAFSVSCNTFFAEAGLEVGPEKLRQVADRFQFNTDYSFALDYKKSSFPLDQSSGESEVMETAIGQGRTLTNPLQMALVTSAVANGGIMMRPYVVDHSVVPGGAIINKNLPEKLAQPITAEQAEFLTGMMEQAVTSGTGIYTHLDGVRVAAKTGTAENASGDDHGWMVAFAPAEKPRVVVSIVLENSGGPRVAQAMARELIGHVLWE